MIRDRPHLYPVPMFSAPEKFKTYIEYNRYHNLDKSKVRVIPRSWDNAIDYIHTFLGSIDKEAINMVKPKTRHNSDMPTMISFKLTDEELSQFEVWLDRKDVGLEGTIHSLLIDGFKNGVSWDGYNDCFIASLTCKEETDVNTGQCLLSRSTHWQEALLLNAFKHYILFERRKWVSRNQNEQRG